MTRPMPIACILTLAAAMAAHSANAQNNSLYGPVPQRAPMTLADTSWTYQASEEPKTAKLHDLVKVTVSVGSEMSSNGKIDRKKQGYGDLKLSKWIKFYGWNLGEDKQNYGTPEVRGEVDNKIQAQADLQTKDKLKFTIACRIVDIRPNGNCVLEGNSTVKDNEETWDYSLTGEVRAVDIKPDNTIASDVIADLKVIKREAGNVRDSYRRGWALEWLDKWQPF